MYDSSGDHPVFAAERREAILQLVVTRGRARTVELAAIFDVAEPTVRKDIIDLAGRGLLRRTYGGALAMTPTQDELTIAARSARNVDAKQLIAAVALGLIHSGEAIYLDNGTTVLALATALAKSLGASSPRNVNVLTNGVEVAQTVSEVPNVHHVLLGGTYRPAGNALTGPLTLDSLRQFSVSTAFMGVSGLAEGGFFVANLGEAQVKSAVIGRADRVVVLMDSSKLGVTDFARVCDLDRVDTLITERVTNELAKQCSAANVEIVAVPS